jgi:hypothetical protein
MGPVAETLAITRRSALNLPEREKTDRVGIQTPRTMRAETKRT